MLQLVNSGPLQFKIPLFQEVVSFLRLATNDQKDPDTLVTVIFFLYSILNHLENMFFLNQLLIVDGLKMQGP